MYFPHYSLESEFLKTSFRAYLVSLPFKHSIRKALQVKAIPSFLKESSNIGDTISIGNYFLAGGGPGTLTGEMIKEYKFKEIYFKYGALSINEQKSIIELADKLPTILLREYKLPEKTKALLNVKAKSTLSKLELQSEIRLKDLLKWQSEYDNFAAQNPKLQNHLPSVFKAQLSFLNNLIKQSAKKLKENENKKLSELFRVDVLSFNQGIKAAIAGTTPLKVTMPSYIVFDKAEVVRLIKGAYFNNLALVDYYSQLDSIEVRMHQELVESVLMDMAGVSEILNNN